MKFFATFFLPLLSITASIHTVAAADQIVLPNIPMDVNWPSSDGRPTLFDLLTIEPRTSIFFSYARELELSRLFVNVDSNITLLVPTNKAVMALARKPYVFSTKLYRPQMMSGFKVTKRRPQSMIPSNCPTKS